MEAKPLYVLMITKVYYDTKADDKEKLSNSRVKD